LGSRLLQRLADDVAELGFVEASPKLDGRNMIMVLAPHKNLQKPQVPKARAGSADAGPEGAEELTATAETVEGQQ
jgi:translation initiation factor IF-3